MSLQSSPHRREYDLVRAAESLRLFDPVINRGRKGLRNRQLPQLPSLDEIGREHTYRVLEYCAENKSVAAEVLGIDRKTLYRLLRRWGSRLGRPS